jgi:hypothetical protein
MSILTTNRAKVNGNDVATLRNRLATALKAQRAAEADASYWNRQYCDSAEVIRQRYREAQAKPRHVRNDSQPTPLAVLDATRPWDDVVDPARGEVTFGVLANADRTVLAAEDHRQQALEDAALEAEWQDRSLTLDRLYAEASARGVASAWGGHELD